MEWFTKDPNATLDYTVDWSRWLGTDTISSVTWMVQTGLVKAAESNTTTTATVWLSGGTLATDYVVTCRITTVGGRIDDRSIKIQVRDR
jgi:hypothetical protein